MSERVLSLSVALDPRPVDGRSVGRRVEQVGIFIDPELPVLGEQQWDGYGASIRLRQWDLQVLIHELLHMILGPEHDPHRPELLAVEVGLAPLIHQLAAADTAFGLNVS